jgi:hypothetical protein
VKFLISILAFYILLLPCFPCTDTDEHINTCKTEIASNSIDNNDHQHENEACNPFCSCACCGQVFYSNFLLEKNVSAKPAENLKQLFFYTNISLSSDFFGNIWQPPKFS